ncbi:hypothetical protein COT42_00980 [Candidatus Saganbacteria bacterium CG08_land_8_20_14_0_20_45_16]|uniref:Prepilin-type N-terminal cleavage/methylation domain-containing protein n=1 Tax=Candidatus Saganbacteria bacterium CG08_land_8_20_14_0_20_45_16 TaxID=2014293 RepID=A0A2H0Y1G7_UNCSA|nr:MAG: hypothetical protein COT42_00980 [Candidatus Saganbacteria bacterium CG08_land_8_20_14_0_20_45_16]
MNLASSARLFFLQPGGSALNKPGFTLVEVLLALSLLLVGATSLSFLLRASQINLASAAKLSLALDQIASQAEILAATPFDQIIAKTNQTFANDCGLIKVVPMQSDLVQIQLSLKWDKEHPLLELETLRSKY